MELISKQENIICVQRDRVRICKIDENSLKSYKTCQNQDYMCGGLPGNKAGNIGGA